MAQSKDNGGLGLGTVLTSTLFLAVILLTVTYLTITKKDVTAPVELSMSGTERLNAIQDDE